MIIGPIYTSTPNLALKYTFFERVIYHIFCIKNIVYNNEWLVDNSHI